MPFSLRKAGGRLSPRRIDRKAVSLLASLPSTSKGLLWRRSHDDQRRRFLPSFLGQQSVMCFLGGILCVYQQGVGIWIGCSGSPSGCQGYRLQRRSRLETRMSRYGLCFGPMLTTEKAILKSSNRRGGWVRAIAGRPLQICCIGIQERQDNIG